MKTRYVVRDHSTYARPDGGRLSSWAVIDTVSRQVVKRWDTRAQARESAKTLNSGGTRRGTRSSTPTT